MSTGIRLWWTVYTNVPRKNWLDLLFYCVVYCLNTLKESFLHSQLHRQRAVWLHSETTPQATLSFYNRSCLSFWKNKTKWNVLKAKVSPWTKKVPSNIPVVRYFSFSPSSSNLHNLLERIIYDMLCLTVATVSSNRWMDGLMDARYVMCKK